MIIISHRANLNGPDKSRENNPDCIDECLALGYDVEVDFWYEDGEMFLGHDEPQYKINLFFC